ncbi:hypothetical protein EVAR_93813_1 [Eumeta japonica]|uniref:Uncharacterized protein n=1 Tax=Eumeta variegata TaxID=151549 RepID=A0A4C1VC60_EUMVA|nr:hypothetical protein EVAR_93813_1 [Eumeta japonica]
MSVRPCGRPSQESESDTGTVNLNFHSRTPERKGGGRFETWNREVDSMERPRNNDEITVQDSGTDPYAIKFSNFEILLKNVEKHFKIRFARN